MNGISVIIPCYNVEKYVEKCIDSILNQKYKKLEIILVDDCSTDNTWKIINKYAKKYENVTAIKNEKNSGAGYSRNNALKYAKYDLVSFIDSDDYVESNYYDSMIKQMKKEKSDVVVCDIFVKYDSVDGTDTRGQACINSKNKYSFVDNGLAASPCNKIFKKKDLLKYPFPEGIMNEDIATVIPTLVRAKKISYNTDTYYNYIQRESSAQNSRLSEKRLDIFKSLDILEKRFPYNKTNKKYWDAIIYNQVIMFFIYVIPKERDKKNRKYILKQFNTLSKKYKIRRNHILWNFLELQGKKHKYYYKALLKANCNGLYWLSNSLISFYHFYSDEVKKSVIKENITIDDVIDMAKYQSNLKKSKISISVVIPNYNYEKFLLQRLYCILYQQVKLNEIIILDDCSTDNSRELIDKIEKKLKKYIKIRKIYNEENSGTAFKQWQKGFSEAKSDYVWIAEADDYSERNFLKETIKPIKKHKDIVISYADTAFIDKDGYIIMRTIKPEIDILKTKHWDKNFVNDGIKEINDYSFLNCTIANVSSVLFKNDDYSEFFKESGKYRQAGDWLFYANVMSKGKISFINKPLNYYRVHGNNVTSLTKKQKHFDEIVKIHKAIEKKFGLSKEQKSKINDRYKFLKRVWGLDEK